MLVDSHCHLNMLNLDKYDGDLNQVVAEANKVGVNHILCVAVDLETMPTVVKIAEDHNNVWASIGLHPSEKSDQEPSVEDFVKWADHPKVVAIGETGLDYHYNDSGLENMRNRFRTQVKAARQTKKPLIIHTRDAREDTLQIMREEKADEVGGVMHCFTESWEMAEQAMDLGFYISFSGIVTFKKAENVIEVAKKVPLERMLIETDAPFLTPVPFRGKPNEPQYVRYVADRIAELKQVSFEEVAEKTTNNFFNLFKGANTR